jgi:hypothetical protein
MSCWGEAAEVVMPIKAATAMAVRTRLRMAFPSDVVSSPRVRQCALFFWMRRRDEIAKGAINTGE